MFAVRAPSPFQPFPSGMCNRPFTIQSPQPVKACAIQRVPMVNQYVNNSEIQASLELQQILSFTPFEQISVREQPSTRYLQGPVLAPSPSCIPSTLLETKPEFVHNPSPLLPSRACNPIVLNTPFLNSNTGAELGLLSPSPPVEKQEKKLKSLLTSVHNQQEKLRKRNRSVSCPVAKHLVIEDV